MSFFVAMGIQIANMIIFGEKSMGDRIYESFYFIFSITFILALCYGVYAGISHLVKIKSFEIFSILGVFINGGWVLLFALAYFLKW